MTRSRKLLRLSIISMIHNHNTICVHSVKLIFNEVFTMLRHIVAWNYKDGLTDRQNKENAQKIKSEMEALTQCIDGIIELKIHINELPSSTRDMVLNSLFESEEALAAYQAHPEHKRVGALVKAATQDRVCIDYHEQG